MHKTGRGGRENCDNDLGTTSLSRLKSYFLFLFDCILFIVIRVDYYSAIYFPVFCMLCENKSIRPITFKISYSIVCGWLVPEMTTGWH